MLWNLIHDGRAVVQAFEAPASTEVGFNGSLYVIEQFADRQAMMDRIADLGLEHVLDTFGNPVAPA